MTSHTAVQHHTCSLGPRPTQATHRARRTRDGPGVLRVPIWPASPCDPSGKAADMGDEDPGNGTCNGSLEVLGEPAASVGHWAPVLISVVC